LHQKRRKNFFSFFLTIPWEKDENNFFLLIFAVQWKDQAFRFSVDFPVHGVEKISV
jgi:hypothetical protein